MNNNGEREARPGRSLERLDHRLLTHTNGGFAVADDGGKLLAKILTLDEVEAWIKIHPSEPQRESVSAYGTT